MKKKIETLYISAQKAIIALLVFAIFLDIILQILSRILPGNSIYWTLEAGELMLAALIWLSLSSGVADNKHIRFDMLVNRMPAKVQAVLEVICSIVFAAFLVFLTIFTWEMLQHYRVNNSTTPSLQWSKFYTKMPMFIGCALGSITLIYKSVKGVLGLFGSKPVDSAEEGGEQ